MTWIRTVPYDRAGDELRRVYESTRALYPAEYGASVPALLKPDGTTDSIVAAHSLIPEAMRHMMSGLAVAMQPHLPLTRRQHEMIASVVSVQNACFYWTESHVEFLRRASLDDELAAELRRDYTQAKLSDTDRAMLDFAVKMTVAPYKHTREDVEKLRAVGFDDTAILQITLIAAFFNYINRVADALGVGKHDSWCPPTSRKVHHG
jgi:uncharacterized peroxidase-related enzyme